MELTMIFFLAEFNSWLSMRLKENFNLCSYLRSGGTADGETNPSLTIRIGLFIMCCMKFANPIS